jgi:D-alanyl-lipoteichoic acid acyltransferase DltB (MBOAT superfamily)
MIVQSFGWAIWMFAAVTGYWLTPGWFGRLWLIALTIAFLMIVSMESAAILCGFSLGTYYLAQSRVRLAPRLLLAGAGIMGLLIWFKLRVAADLSGGLAGLAIPLGLSYYALRCIHYIVERYKGSLPAHDFADFVSYLFFLPTLIAGPIHRFAEFQRDSRRMRWDSEKFSEGLERILYGYVKITFIANFLIYTRLGLYIGRLPPDDAQLAAYLTMIQKGLNGYLLFSGYSDVAIGFALLLGYRVMENFRWPLLKPNISEFWKSWHISLSSWCRDYVYMLVVSFTRRPALGVIAAMLAIGLWHEISHRYILWGIYNGLGIVAWQQFQQLKRRMPPIAALERPWARKSLQALSILVTFHFVMAGFVIVQQPTLADTYAFFQTMLGRS